MITTDDEGYTADDAAEDGMVGSQLLAEAWQGDPRRHHRAAGELPGRRVLPAPPEGPARRCRGAPGQRPQPCRKVASGDDTACPTSAHWSGERPSFRYRLVVPLLVHVDDHQDHQSQCADGCYPCCWFHRLSPLPALCEAPGIWRSHTFRRTRRQFPMVCARKWGAARSGADGPLGGWAVRDQLAGGTRASSLPGGARESMPAHN